MLFGIIYWIHYGVDMSVQSSFLRYLWSICAFSIGIGLWFCYSHFTKQLPLRDNLPTTITLQPTDYTHRLRLQARPHAPTVMNVSSPIAGIVHRVHSQYGDIVSPSKPLFTIASPETKRNYIDTIISFLKSKEQLHVQQKKADNNQQLYASDIISREEYQQAQNALYTAQVDYLKVEYQLKTLCHLLDTKWTSVAKMTLKDTHILHDMLEDEMKVTVFSGANGVFLTSAQDTSSNKRLTAVTEGSKVEPGQLVGMVGKPNVLEFNLAVAEDDIASIQVGQLATISALAGNVPSIEGSVIAINKHPSQQSNNSNQYMYGVTVEASCPDQCGITLGMNAAVDIHTGTLTKVFVVPFSSIFKEEQNSYVMRQMPSGTFEKHRVQVGRTLPDGIIITQGLSTGDSIASHYTMS